MSDIPVSSDCQGKLQKQVEKDDFLNSRCQIDKLNLLLNSIQAELSQLDIDVQHTLHRLKLETQQRFIDLKNEILSTRSALSHQFTKLVEIQSIDKYAVRAAISRVDRMLSRLSKTIHPHLNTLLQSLAPESNLIPDFITKLSNSCNRIAGQAPDQITLVIDFYTLNCLPQGVSIFEQYQTELENAYCIAGGKEKPSALRKHRRWLKKQLRVIDIPLAQIVTQHFLERKESPADKLSEQHQELHDKLNLAMHDTWRAIRFNLEEVMAEFEDILDLSLEMTSEELGKRIQEPEQLVLDGLEKAAESFDTVAEQYFQFIEHLYSVIIHDGNDSLNTLQLQVDRILSLKEAPRKSKYHLRYRASLLWGRLNRAISHNVEDLNDTHRALLVKLRMLFQRGINKLKRNKESSQSLLQLTDLPTTQEISSSSRNLPSIYRRLFSQKPLLDQDLVVCRETQLDQFLDIFDRWKNGGESAIAIIGQEGSGKKTLLNVLEAEIEDQYKVTRFEIGERLRSEQDVIRLIEHWLELEETHNTVDELIHSLHALPRQVLFVESPHKLLLRSIGLRRAPYAFLYIVLATRSHFLWVIPFKLYPWERLSYLFDVSRYFTHKIQIDFHDQDQLSEAIMLRQRSSQYPLIFSAEVENKQVNILVKNYGLESGAAQKALARLYFEELFLLSGGNMNAALYYWLYSANFNTLTQTIEISPCVHIDTRFIQDLDKLYLFTLGEIINHGEMSPAEHAEIFNLNQFVSRSRLEYLRHIRLLEPTRIGRNQLPSSYAINPVFFHPVISVLNAQHILY